jgi:hypothetical protein
MKTKLTRLLTSAVLALLGMMAACLLIIFLASVVVLIVSLLPIQKSANATAIWSTAILFAVAFAGITYAIYQNKA